jgi:signal transduction histidine kinase
MWSVDRNGQVSGGTLTVGPLQPSGRVIASGRLLLAFLFLVAGWANSGQSAPGMTLPLLSFYFAWALGVTLLVWNSWWLDARLAAPAHVVDVTVFMIMLYSSEGYTSPYFIFFIFILLSAAIRWGWKETAVTSAAIVGIYFAAGLLRGPSPALEVEPFIIRTGHLLTLSAILIWFGSHRWFSGQSVEQGATPLTPIGGDTFMTALQSGMAALGARQATLFWQETADEDVAVFRMDEGEAKPPPAGTVATIPPLPGALLFDPRKDRLLMRIGASRWRFLRASAVLPAGLSNFIAKGAGLAVPIASGTAAGLAVFQGVPALSTDHLDFAPRLAAEMAARVQAAALLAAVEERSMGKARVDVARDLHDSIVQFLAGVGFQLEALNRSPAATGALGKSLAELKDTVMAEQRHLRAFVRGLRTGKPVSLRDLARDCASLCQLLARQWNIECDFAGKSGSGRVSVRTQLDIQHLVREAVANAVRHGDAKKVTVSMRRDGDQLHLAVADDGRGFALSAAGGQPTPPRSLRARVRDARGDLEVRSKPGDTIILIRLPMEAAP